jgi:hypothetical protein
MMEKVDRRQVLKSVSVASVGITANFSVLPTEASTDASGQPYDRVSELAVYNNSDSQEDVTVEVQRNDASESLFTKTISLHGLNSPANPLKAECHFTGLVDAQGNNEEYTVKATLDDGRSAQTEVLLTPDGVLNGASISIYVRHDGELVAWTSIS